MMRILFAAAIAAILCAGTAARAADMPEGPPPVVMAPPLDGDVATCSAFSGRHADRVWQPGQPAYIVAQSCGPHSLSHWLRFLGVQRRENMLVYYNGGSMYRTDIRSINVPVQPQIH